MRKIEFSSLQEVFENDQTDINLKILKFLNGIAKYNEPIITDYAVINKPYRIYDLLNEGEYIRTQANEVPQKNGDWDYNGGYTYDLYYILLDNNNLIVNEQKRSIDYFPGDPIHIRFLLYPNAHQFIIKNQNGHRANRPYLNIIDNNGELVSQFYFEMPYNESSVLNNLSLQNAITPICIENLINKNQEQFQNKQHILCKKK